MVLCITSERVGVYCVMDRHNLDAGVLFEAPTVAACRKWATKHNAENIINTMTRILGGETVGGLVLGLPGINEDFCRTIIEEYREVAARS